MILDGKALSQKIKVNGYCEKLIIANDYIFYVDKLKNDIWSIELKNGYALKNVGRFPNISAFIVLLQFVFIYTPFLSNFHL